MKKIITILIIIIVILTSISIFEFVKILNLTKTETNQNPAQTTNYGKRGNISETERVKFLTESEEIAIGMMGLEYSENEVTFTDENMIQFALYIAQARYQNELSKININKSKFVYRISTDTISDIIYEYFGNSDVGFSTDKSEYYNKANKEFRFHEEFEKSLYYYPVSQETTDDKTTITVDAIYIDDTVDASTYNNAKYDGQYTQEDVDNNIKLSFNKEGYLVSYQYIKK